MLWSVSPVGGKLASAEGKGRERKDSGVQFENVRVSAPSRHELLPIRRGHREFARYVKKKKKGLSRSSCASSLYNLPPHQAPRSTHGPERGEKRRRGDKSSDVGPALISPGLLNGLRNKVPQGRKKRATWPEPRLAIESRL